MEQLKHLQQYLHEVLGITVDLHPWKNRQDLPIFLNDLYDFYETSLLGHSCLLIFAKDNDITPGIIRKHWEQIQSLGVSSIYIQPTISSYNRKRLIEQHIPFIVPGNQMYLPEVGIELREHFRKLHSKKQSYFSPATQAVVIYALTHETKFTTSILAKKLGYTLMTMARAFDELKATNIGEIHLVGRERVWSFPNKKTLFEQAKPFLHSPVKKRVWLHHAHPKIIAGLSALSQFSMLNPPTLPVFAISTEQWKKWKQSGVKEWPSPEGANLELEIWQYDPKLFAKDGAVDRFSLYLSMEANQDERIEAALEKMMKEIKW